MKQEDIIRMAREAGFDPHDMSSDFTCNLFSINAFAELVRADERDRAMRENAYVLAEREACAKVCEPQEEHDDPLTAWKIAKAIRARENT